MLSTWVHSLIAEGLDTWYETPPGAASLARMRCGLISALSGRSAIQVLVELLRTRPLTRTLALAPDPCTECGRSAIQVLVELLRLDSCTKLTDVWTGSRLLDAATEIESTVHSMCMEGFNVSVPLHMRPVGIPSHHAWWLAAPPMHRNGLMC